MNTTFEIPYNRYALIGRLAQQGRSPGRTALQKYLYLLQSALGAEPVYDFSMYTYGPFSSQVLTDLEVAEAMGVVKTGRTSYGVYAISPGPEVERISSLAKEFLAQSEVSLEKLFRDFGSFNAKELELRSTIIFASQELEKSGRPMTELPDTVQEIKPGFTHEEIRAAISELSELGYLGSGLGEVSLQDSSKMIISSAS